MHIFFTCTCKFNATTKNTSLTPLYANEKLGQAAWLDKPTQQMPLYSPAVKSACPFERKYAQTHTACNLSVNPIIPHLFTCYLLAILSLHAPDASSKAHCCEAEQEDHPRDAFSVCQLHSVIRHHLAVTTPRSQAVQMVTDCHVPVTLLCTGDKRCHLWVTSLLIFIPIIISCIIYLTHYSFLIYSSLVLIT